ncbi:IS1400 transposase A [Serratia sp. M24T3]|nr:IS1400 transposase A [Serratia sp. M24T3]
MLFFWPPSLTVSIPVKRPIHLWRSSDILIMSPEEISMRKIRFTEHQIIAVLKSVEAGRTVKDVCRESGITPLSLTPHSSGSSRRSNSSSGNLKYSDW